jgi:hypothetical protein
MKSLRDAACAVQNPPPFTSLRGFANDLNLPVPISLSHLYDELRAPVTFHADIVTPPGTALGGTVDLTVSSDGHTVFNVHMHDSGFDPYTFRVRCALRAPSGLIFLYQTSGHTDGTGSNLLGHVQRDFDHNEDSFNPSIKAFWTDFRFATMAVSKSYEDAGLLNTLEDIAKDLIGFLLADVTLGAGLALVVCISADLSNAFNGSFIGPGGLVGVVVAGGIAWVWGPSAIIASIVLGVTAGAIVDAAIKHRSLTQEEYDFAGLVFQGTLPPRERFFVTNLSHQSGRKYTWPEVDGSIILNLGDEAYADPMHFVSSRYPARGQVFIHEMSHAWQIQTKSFIPGILCDYLTKTHTYTVGAAGKAWSDYGIEQQATIVDTWFGTYALNWVDVTDAARRLASDPALKDSFFPYIQNNIRLGQN